MSGYVGISLNAQPGNALTEYRGIWLSAGRHGDHDDGNGVHRDQSRWASDPRRPYLKLLPTGADAENRSRIRAPPRGHRLRIQPRVAPRGRSACVGGPLTAGVPAPARTAARRGVARFTLTRMRSPDRTSPSGPPTAHSGETWRMTVPNAVPLIRASEIRTMSFTPARASFGRNRQVARLRHAGANRTRILQHQHIVCMHVEVRIVDARSEIFQVLEDHRASVVLEQTLVGRGALEDRAVRREVAEQREQTAVRWNGSSTERITARSTKAGGLPQPLARASRRSPSDSRRLQQRLQLVQHGADAAGCVEIFHVVLARRLQVDQHRRRLAERVQVMQVERTARRGRRWRPGG